MKKFKVKVQNEEGKYLLQELHGLKEGDVIEGNISKYSKTAVEFKLNGQDAVLWPGSNCVPYHERKRLPKGWMLDVTCWAKDIYNPCIECCGTKAELLDAMKERGYERGDFEVMWVVRDYNHIKDHHGFTEGIGDTKEEAIKDFWREYNKK